MSEDPVPTARTVVLREERSAHGSYHLRAHLLDGGSLVIEGQDLGAAPESFWGSREYEWTLSVPPEQVPGLVSALGGTPGDDDPLELLAARFRQDERCASRSFLEEAGVAFGFWSRVGD
jgi:hypothetical protein